ncbi:hypothetical protein I7I53_11900 [Histoplasma capsulatum var. duboisii H88]|uniref:Uncharacterized protein n=1 Tax=Ajellomyces capsulatus (strain H88) TaxID=544711 RepID=A0A8A1M0E3_AJEC8|nr:hypothetical protein I7I53_11900 [Histoplasma capsulatum var. duboisii H88]
MASYQRGFVRSSALSQLLPMILRLYHPTPQRLRFSSIIFFFQLVNIFMAARMSAMFNVYLLTSVSNGLPLLVSDMKCEHLNRSQSTQH